ncbi:MAG: histone-like nucleoid-structuring protein Lsr2 [Jiangellaceae bacterium]
MAAAEQPATSSDIRAWARARGLDVAPRGRLAAEVVNAYHAAHAT